jgi:hypothetical protein
MATTYRYLFADLRTNAILAELPLTDVSFTQVLNGAGTFNARILISDAREAGYDIQNVTIPARTAIYVDRDGVLVWGGIIWLRNYNSADQHITLSAREFASYLERRRITTTTVFSNTDQLTIAQSLINTAQAVAGGNIGLIVPTNTSGILVSRVYFDYEFKDVFSAIKDLSNSNTGFDFNIDVQYDSTGTPRKYVRTSYPQRGLTYNAADSNSLVFEFPGNMSTYEWPDDGSIVANTMYGIGPNSNEAKIRATAVGPANQVGAGWPFLEDTTTYNDQYDATLLQSQVLAEVTARQNPVVTVKVTLPAYVSPALGNYQTGDQCLLRITDDRFPQPSYGGYGNASVQRIVAITVQPGEDAPELVTLTLADPSI